jgi:hypothetical protein
MWPLAIIAGSMLAKHMANKDVARRQNGLQQAMQNYQLQKARENETAINGLVDQQTPAKRAQELADIQGSRQGSMQSTVDQVRAASPVTVAAGASSSPDYQQASSAAAERVSDRTARAIKQLGVMGAPGEQRIASGIRFGRSAGTVDAGNQAIANVGAGYMRDIDNVKPNPWLTMLGEGGMAAGGAMLGNSMSAAPAAAEAPATWLRRCRRCGDRSEPGHEPGRHVQPAPRQGAELLYRPALMPTFRTAPSSDLGSAIRRAVQSSNLGPMGEIQADMAAAQTAKNLSLAEKARVEAENAARSQTYREDPANAVTLASRVAGMTDPQGTRMSDHLRGALEQPSQADIDDADRVGAEATPFATQPPVVSAGQKRAFETSIAATIANRFATGKTNPEQIAQAAQRLNDTSIAARASDAAEAGNVPLVNALAVGVLGKRNELTPFKTNAQGVTTNEYTGKVDESSQLAGVTRKDIAAQAAQRTAAAGTGGATGEPTAALPGGKGSKLMQEPDTGARFAVNEATGRAWKASEKGWEPVLVTNLPKNLQKFGSAATAGNRESIFNQRVIMGANQAAKDLHNVTKLPLTASTGVFGGRKQGPGLLDAGKEVLANKMTSQEAQQYNVMSTGFQRSLAAIESAGLMPSGALTHQMDAVLFKEGDTNLTKLHKLAQTRQIVESGMETVLNNPRVSEPEKKQAREIVDNLRKAVPFTHEDLINLEQAQQVTPDTSLKDVISKAPPAGGAPVLPKGWKIEKVTGG